MVVAVEGALLSALKTKENSWVPSSAEPLSRLSMWAEY